MKVNDEIVIRDNVDGSLRTVRITAVKESGSIMAIVVKHSHAPLWVGSEFAYYFSPTSRYKLMSNNIESPGCKCWITNLGAIL